MSSYKTNNFIKRTSRVISYLLVVLLLLGIVGVCINLFNRPNGIYLRYGDTVITSKTGGITVPQGEAITLRIENSEDWGAYSVTDCTVTIVPNVDSAHDFDFTVEGDSSSSSFSGEKDFTAAFTDNYDGNGLMISADGDFTIRYSARTVSEMLKTVNGKEITIENDYYLSAYPYVAIQVVSPDGKQTLTVPLLLYGVVTGIELNPSEVIF